MESKPRKEHEWLQKLVGEWAYEAECDMGPDQPPSKTTGTEIVRSLGGLWVLCEGSGEMPGCGPATTLMTLGYDPTRERFVGTFVASMMTHLWIYDGELDPKGKKLSLNAEGPSMTVEGEMARYQDVIEFASNDRRTLTAHLLGRDGSRQVIMTAHYRRKK